MLVIACLLTGGSVWRLRSSDNVKQVRLLHIADTHAQLDAHWEYLPEHPARLHQMDGLREFALPWPSTGRRVHCGRRRHLSRFRDGRVDKRRSRCCTVQCFASGCRHAGNWESVYGPGIFRKLMAELSEVICFNFHEKSTSKRLFAPAAVLQRGGMRNSGLEIS